MKILILGGSSGIGKGFAMELSKENELIVASKDNEDLKTLKEELVDSSVNTICVDLTNKEDLIKLCNEYRDVDMVINSAGIGRLGDITRTPLELEENNINLNVNSFHYITKFFANEMIARKRGTIINVCSSASFVPMPNFSLYAATKAFCGSYTIAVSKECKKHNVYIMALCPGPTYTKFLRDEEFKKLKEIYKIKGIISTPDIVVKKSLRAIKKRKRVYIPGLINKIIYYFDKFMPTSLVIDIIYKCYIKIIGEVDNCKI